MKPFFKIIAIIFCLQFALYANAQIHKKDVGATRAASSAQQNKQGNAGISITSTSANKNYFIGIWEFTQFGTDPDNLGPSALGVLKINTDTSFTVVRYQNNQAIITQTGTFRVPTADVYFQRTLFQLPVFGTKGVGEDFKINYRFTPDRKFVTLSYTAFSGEVCYEVWRKL